MCLFNTCYVLGYCQRFLASHSSSSCYLITVVLSLNPWDQFCIFLFLCQELSSSSNLPFSQHVSQPLCCLPPWAHTAHPSHPPSECQSLPSLPKTPHLPFYPFLPTAAASKLFCQGGEGGNRGGTEITSAAEPGCPLLCAEAARRSSSS